MEEQSGEKEGGQKMKNWLILCCFVLLINFTALSSFAQGKPDFRISTKPGEVVDEVAILFETDGQTATIPVFIEYVGSSSLENINFYGQLTDCQGHFLTVGQVRILQTQTDQLAGPLTFKPDDGQRRVRLRISGLGEKYGNFCGYLSAEIDGHHYTYTDLLIERPVVPVLTIKEANNGEITLISHQPTLDEAIFIAETGGKTGVNDLKITISPLRAEGDDTIIVTPQPAELPLSANRSSQVVIEGSIPNVTRYKGTLRLEWDDQVQEYALVVERKPGIQAINIDALAPVEGSRFPFYPASLDIPITLSETTGNQTEVHKPVLTQLRKVDDEGAESAASFSGWKLKYCHDGTPLTQDPLPFTSYQKECIRFSISGLNSNGHFKAKIAVITHGGAEKTADVAIYLRHHWLIAAVVIFLGTLGSYKVRRWLAIDRPNRQKEIKIVQFEETIQSKIPEPGDTVRQALLRKLTELRYTLQIDSSLDVDARLQEQVTQLNQYLPVYTILPMEPQKIIADPAKHQEAQERLDAIKALLTDPLANLEKANEKAESLRKNIDQWNQEYLRTAVQKIREAIAKDRELLDKLQIDDAPRKDFQDKLENIEQNLSVAEDVTTSYEEARTTYETARQAYIRLSAERLQLVLQGQDRPAGFSDADWQTQRDGLLAKLTTVMEKHADDPSALQSATEKVRTEYLQVVIECLKVWADRKITDFESDGSPSQNVEKLSDVIKSLEAAEEELRQGELDSAEQEYIQAAQAYAEALPQDQQGSLQDEAGHVQADAPALPSGYAGDPGGMTDQSLPPQESVAAIVKDIKTNDLFAALFVGCISVLSGLLILWSPNNTFGDLADYILAFSWGAGLHTLNKIDLPAAAGNLQLPFFPARDQE
ncbi:MAG: hypothetical protein GY801_22280 [bacterium]|nr:hypothetical protein [bacterium]